MHLTNGQVVARAIQIVRSKNYIFRGYSVKFAVLFTTNCKYKFSALFATTSQNGIGSMVIREGNTEYDFIYRDYRIELRPDFSKNISNFVCLLRLKYPQMYKIWATKP